MQTLWMGVRPGPTLTRVLAQAGPIPILKARLPELAADLARQNCDVVLVPARKRDLSRSSRRSGDTPIVIVANDYDPVGTGHIASLAHPGGRITRVSQLWPERAMREAKVASALVEMIAWAGGVAPALSA